MHLKIHFISNLYSKGIGKDTTCTLTDAAQVGEANQMVLGVVRATKENKPQTSRVEDSSNLYHESFFVNISTNPATQFEDLIMNYIKSTDVRMKTMETALKSQLASIHKKESQIRELIRLIPEKPIDSRPHNLEEQLDEHTNPITLSSGRELVEPPPIIVDEKKGTS